MPPAGDGRCLVGQGSWRSRRANADWSMFTPVTKGLVGIVVSKDDLLSILEERPSVALAMLATLSRRLADQNRLFSAGHAQPH